MSLWNGKNPEADVNLLQVSLNKASTLWRREPVWSKFQYTVSAQKRGQFSLLLNRKVEINSHLASRHFQLLTYNLR